MHEHLIQTLITTCRVLRCIFADPCAAVKCPVGSLCKVYQPTGEPFCQPSCRVQNGGCPKNTKCELVPVECIRAPCPPEVNCRKIGKPTVVTVNQFTKGGWVGEG